MRWLPIIVGLGVAGVLVFAVSKMVSASEGPSIGQNFGEGRSIYSDPTFGPFQEDPINRARLYEHCERYPSRCAQLGLTA